MNVNHHLGQIQILAQYLDDVDERELYGNLLHIADEARKALRLLKQERHQKQPEKVQCN